ncbi:STT3 domain-containing protein [Thermoproteota archaeon]
MTKKHKWHDYKEEKPSEEEEVEVKKEGVATKYLGNIELQPILGFLQKYGWVFLLLIVIFASVWFRAYPIYLPITDDWAENSVENFYRSQVTAQVRSQYPNLPEENMQTLVNTEYEKVKQSNQKVMQQQIETTSKQFKERMKDDTGQTYLLAIDPWLMYGYARNYVENGHWGDELINGESRYTLRNGREGQNAGFRMLPFLMVINHKMMNIFTDASVLAAAFYIPLILITLAAIAAFFIGRKIGGNMGAVTAGVVVGIHAALLNRTAAGFSDTDNIIAFGEMLTVAVFVLAFSEKDERNKWIYTILAGLVMGLYANAHQSWWHIFDFLVGALGIWLVYQAWIHHKEFAKGLTKFVNISEIKKIWQLGIGFVVATWIAGATFAIFRSGTFALQKMITEPFLEPLAFLARKEVAITTIWPNVLTTVAELNRISMNTIISQIGGRLLFILSIIGIIFLLLRKEDGKRKYLFYGVLLAFWYIGALYAATTSVRFVAFLVPAFALGIAAFVAFTYEYSSKVASRNLNLMPIVTKTVVIVLVIVIIFMPLAKAANSTARSEVPSMNDAWYDALLKIQHDSDDGIITSWWDFGHWFVAVGQRRVTFDGGDQGERIHWAGRTLREDNETQSVGILRMLNCAQEKAPHRLSEMLGSTIKTDVQAIDILYSIFSLDKDEAKEVYLENGLTEAEAEEMLSLTHCEDLIKQYYITSEDMIGKAGVWAHFGSWDFHKAAMFNQVKNKEYVEGVTILKEDFNISDDNADKIYYDIQSNTGDQWISPWPGYLSGVKGCSQEAEKLSCIQSLQGQQIKFEVDLDTMTVTLPGNKDVVPDSIVYPTEDSTVEKELTGKKAGFSIVLIPSGNGYNSLLASPQLANSIFTRTFFMEGHGLKHFRKFDDRTGVTGVRIITWTVDWEGGEPNKPYYQEPEVVVEEVEEIEEEPIEEVNETVEETTENSTEEPSNITESDEE